jgi:hypothetical protein
MRFAIPVLAGLLFAAPAAHAQIIYDNASTVPGAISPIGIVTNPGGGFGGADLSVLTAPDANFGFGHQNAANNRLIDDFTVPAGFQWTITRAHVFGYVTGATTPTTTAGVAQFFNAQPTVGSVPISGNTTTNLLSSAVFTNIYRSTPALPNAVDRRIVDNTLTLATPLILGPGTYWMEYGLVGNNFSPALNVAPPAGGIVTGNALQFQGATSTYVPLVDPALTGVAKGVAFQLEGTVAPIPEPTSLALVGLVGAASFGWRRLRKK